MNMTACAYCDYPECRCEVPSGPKCRPCQQGNCEDCGTFGLCCACCMDSEVPE